MLDASGLIHIEGDLFLVAEDERDSLRFFRYLPEEAGFRSTGRVLHFGDQESDFESIAHDPVQDRYYCIGSHSKDDSRVLLGFRIGDYRVSDLREIDFEPRLLLDGEVNIESLSVHRGSLFAGLRSPTIHGRAAALVFNPESGAQLLGVFDLDERVFRDMVRIDDDNYLILSGPRRGRDYDELPACIHWWNGDLLAPVLHKSTLNLSGYRAEGICNRRAADGSIEVFIGTDESKVEGATRFRMLRATARDLPALLSLDGGPLELDVRL